MPCRWKQSHRDAQTSSMAEEASSRCTVVTFVLQDSCCGLWVKVLVLSDTEHLLDGEIHEYFQCTLFARSFNGHISKLRNSVLSLVLHLVVSMNVLFVDENKQKGRVEVCVC